MIVGVTGTRSGMTQGQRAQAYQFLVDAQGVELHHGDCVGVDVEVAELARDLGYKIVCHPPEIDSLRGYADYDVTHNPKSYFARNRDIVDECDILLVIPYQTSHQTQGGTWYTHDYALKKNKPVHVIFPEIKR